VFFLFVAGHCRREKEGGRKPFQIHMFFRLSWRQRVNPRTASSGGAWRRRAATVFVVQKDSPAIPGVFRGYFANFKLFHVIFFLFSFEFLLFVVLM
jgi:hypothetical protein